MLRSTQINKALLADSEKKRSRRVDSTDNTASINVPCHKARICIYEETKIYSKTGGGKVRLQNKRKTLFL